MSVSSVLNLSRFVVTAFSKRLQVAFALLALSSFMVSFYVQSQTSHAPQITPYALEPHAWIELEGLPNDSVFDMVTDHNNHIWMGGYNVILHYDGKQLTKYQPKHEHGNLRFIYSVTVRENGDVFAMSHEQLYKFEDEQWQPWGPKISPLPYTFWLDKKIAAGKDNFWQLAGGYLLRIDQQSYEHIPLSNGPIQQIVIDSNNFIWVLFQKNGDVKRYGVHKQTLVEVNHWPNVITDTKGAKLNYQANGELWLTNHDKTQPPLKINAKHIDNKHQPARWQPVEYPTATGYRDQAVIISQNDNTLIFSEQNLHLFANNQWRSVPLVELGIERDVLMLTEAKNGDIWLLELGRSIKRFAVHNPRQTTFEKVLFGCEGQNNEFFIHQNGDVLKHDVIKNTWSRYSVKSGLIDTPVGIKCTSTDDVIVYGSNNKVAAISYISESELTNPVSQTQVQQQWRTLHLPELSENIGLLSVLETKAGELYFGRNDESHHKGGKLVKLTKTHDKYQKHLIELPLNRVATLTELDDKLVYSNEALYKVKPSAQSTEASVSELSMPDNMIYSWIEALSSDQEQQLWVATWHYGVLSYQQGAWRQYALNEGLRGKNVSSIINLDNNHVLALNNQGVDRFDGLAWQALDIFGVRSIREGSNLVAASDDRLWVNQASRDWFFRFENKTSAKPVKDSEHLAFHTVKYQANDLPPLVEIKLNSTLENYQNSVLVSWRGYDQWFETPSKSLKYAYRINGGDWSIFSSDTSHYFTDLAPEQHLVEVVARDADGNITTEPARLSFVIQSPFWQQAWFFVALAVLFVLLLITTFILIAQRLQQTNKINQARMHFLTNISHELRNPLSLIISPLEQYFVSREQQSTKDENGLNLALRNAKRLKQLIDQLLEYRRLQAGNIKLVEQEGDLILMCKLLLSDLNVIAERKQQQIKFHTQLEHYYCFFDSDVMRKVIENLLTNAIKYSPDGKSIYLTIDKHPVTGVIVAVEDQGIGIPAKEQKQIFDPFYTQKRHQFNNQNSFGIGLALVRDLVNVMQGHISLLSPPVNKTQGSCFTVTLPLLTETSGEHLVVEGKTETPQLSVRTTELETQQGEVISSDVNHDEGKPQILLVDDNTELVDYMAQQLSESYNCIVAYDGQQALLFAKDKVPDVIVSDYKMPNMDGLQLCQALKDDVTTSHIPVLLHTAMTSEDHQMKGLAFGAVDYLLKPVSIPMLKQRINNVIENRKRYASFVSTALQQPAPHTQELQQELQQETTSAEQSSIEQQLEEQQKVQLTDSEAKFLAQVKTHLLSHFSSPEFNAEQLAQMMFMSRSAFYRKFSALTNITPAEYIKTHRLNTAHELLAQGYTVSQILTQTGYSDPSSFNRAYKSFFGVNPSKQTAQS